MAAMNRIDAEGTIRRQGMTIYQYGTHILVDQSGRTRYALSSDQIDLNNYVDHHVRVSGTQVSGYPVDLGPDYLEVEDVQIPPAQGR
jgi:hypothetical protein